MPSLAAQMKTKRKSIALGAIILLPMFFALAMHREVAGGITIFTLRGTQLRLYQSDSGNLASAKRSESERLLKEPEWMVTRKNKAAWWAVNVGTLYIEMPFLVADLVNQRN